MNEVTYVNSEIGNANMPGRGNDDSGINCAACTAVGAVNLTIGKSMESTAMVREEMGGVYLGTNRKDQKSNISKYVESRTTRTPTSPPDEEMPLREAEKWMRLQPEETVFAVRAEGYVKKAIHDSCHWLN